MLAIIVGLVITARPTFLLISPLVVSIIGYRRSAIAAIVAIGSIFATWPWPAMRFATNPSAKLAGVGIFMLASIMAVVLKTKRDKIMCVGLLLCLPAFLSSCNAQHLLFALPFLLASTLKKEI
jgi:hypothetical protein